MSHDSLYGYSVFWLILYPHCAPDFTVTKHPIKEGDYKQRYTIEHKPSKSFVHFYIVIQKPEKEV